MIIYFLGVVVTMVLSAVSSIFGEHSYTIASIPYVGQGFSDVLYAIVGYWNSFLQTLPYFQLPWTIFVKFMIPFEIALLLAKSILGSRVPVRDN